MLLPFSSAPGVRKSGDTMTGDLHLSSQNAANGTKRLYLQTYEETGLSDYTEVIRIDMLTDSAKGAIAWRDKDLFSQAWVQMHDYLHFYNTQTITSVDDPGNTVNVPSHGIPTGWKVTLTTTGTLPTGLAVLTTYYVRAVNADTLTFFSTAADAVANTSKITFTGSGSGVIQVVPDNTYNFNRHKHWSVEVADSLGAKQTRLSIPYGFDTTEMTVFNSNFNIASNILRIWGDTGTNRQMIFAKTPASPDSYLPPLDTSIPRWSILANSTAEAGSSVGSDFQISRFNDSGVFIDVPLFIKRSNGNVGLGNTTTPTGRLHLPAGTATASTSPLKFTSGTSLTTPEAGAVEYDGNNLYFTGGALLRGSLPRVLYSQSASGTVSNTAAETTLIGAGVGSTTLPANFFVAGRTVRLSLKGVLSTTGTPTLLLNVKLGSTVIIASATVTLPSSITNRAFVLEIDITCRVAGASGTFIGEGSLILDNSTTPYIIGFAGIGTVTVDTTAAQALDLTATFGTASSSNVIASKTGVISVQN
jgi:hypothetical protein